MKKHNIIWFIIVILIILFAGGAAIYANKINDKDENELLKDKVKEEINYLDSKISSMLNSLNNINLRNYIVKSEEINTQSSGDEGQKSSKGDSAGDSQSGQSEQNQEDSDSKSSGSSSGGNEEEPKTTTQMEQSTVIGNDKSPRWNNLKSEIENLYSSWNVIILDLYKLNIDGNKILQFSDLLDNLTLNIKDENKEECLNTLTNMYSSIVGYVNDFSNEENFKKILTTRENIFYAYANVDSKNWDEIQKRLQQAEAAYVDNLNNDNNSQKEFNLNKGYILLKELQNSISQQDEDVFYVKYKNLIEELNLIMS